MYSVIEEVLMDERFCELGVVIYQPLHSIIRDLHKFNVYIKSIQMVKK